MYVYIFIFYTMYIYIQYIIISQGVPRVFRNNHDHDIQTRIMLANNMWYIKEPQNSRMVEEVKDIPSLKLAKHLKLA